MPCTSPATATFAARTLLAAGILSGALLSVAPVRADTIDTSAGPMEATVQAADLTAPWGFDFLPDGTVLVTERAGGLWAVRDGTKTAVTGLPEITEWGQGGLMDVLVPSDFEQSRAVFFTYADVGFLGRRVGTAVLRARLSEDGTRIEDSARIFAESDYSRLGRHFGSRLAEAPDGTLFVTIGDRGTPVDAQDLGMHAGTIVRIARDGSVPADNPFVDTGGARPEIWSYGHRNPQGMAFDLAGQLWVNEHGARGGDEVNRIARGANYGWPVIAYGVNYDGTPIGEGTERAGMMQPVFYWDPSIAPSGMVFHDGAAVPSWRGDAFVGSLKFNYIARLSGDPLREVERIESDETLRVRDVDIGPDGALWFLSVGNGALYSLAPAVGG